MEKETILNEKHKKTTEDAEYTTQPVPIEIEYKGKVYKGPGGPVKSSCHDGMCFEFFIRKLIFLPLLWLILSSPAKGAGTYIKKQIRYHVHYANEVYILWGINGWKWPEDIKKTKDSYLKKDIIYTKMEKQGEDFVSDLYVPKDCMINFCFLITKGPLNADLEVWDTNFGANEKDYKTHADESIVSYVAANPEIVKPITYSFVSYGKWILLILSLLTVVHFSAQKYILHKNRV